MQLTEEKILTWARAHKTRAGKRPTLRSGRVRGTGDLDWSEIDGCLEYGGFGLPGGSSLAKLLREHAGSPKPKPTTKPRLTMKQILAWADAYHERHGDWPRYDFGIIEGAKGETWSGINAGLRYGYRGLPGGVSLATLLAQRRGKRHLQELADFSITRVLKWVDAHRARTGDWPSVESGDIPGAPGETWRFVHAALMVGARGLPKMGSLVKLLAARRGRRNRMGLSKLTTRQILEWADAYFARQGQWPNHKSGPIAGTKHEAWGAINGALKSASRGLRHETTLGALLAKHRNVAVGGRDANRLSVPRILDWADAHKHRTGEWPSVKSGRVVGALDESWSAIDASLRVGRHGLRGGSSLSQELDKHRAHDRLRPLTIKQILAWADAHLARTGKRPARSYGCVRGTESETWSCIDHALRYGIRGLPGGSSLPRLLDKHHIFEKQRGARKPERKPRPRGKSAVSHGTRGGRGQSRRRASR